MRLNKMIKILLMASLVFNLFVPTIAAENLPQSVVSKKSTISNKKSRKAVKKTKTVSQSKQNTLANTTFFEQAGIASYYADKLNGRQTASGEIYRVDQFTAAHRRLPFGTYVLVKNLTNNRQVVVKINDRGPFSGKRIIDLSKASAKELKMIRAGTAKVKVEMLQFDHQGYLISPQATQLAMLAKQFGFDFKVREETPDTAQQAVRSAGKFTIKIVQLATEKEAMKIMRQLNYPAVVEPHSNGYDVIIQVATETELITMKKDLWRLGHYQIFTYSEK